MATNINSIKKQNSIALANANEEALLTIIKQQKWIREDEAALLLGKSKIMIARTATRLCKREEIYRDKRPAGFFLRLKTAGGRLVGGESGKNVEIPISWQHHCLSLQSLVFLNKEFACESFKTETQIRAALSVTSKKGKIPDGKLFCKDGAICIEAEWSHKNGERRMQPQARNMIALAKDAKKVRSVVCYPYGDGCDVRVTRDHEKTNTTAIRKGWGDAPAPGIKFLRCFFDTRTAFLHCRISRFELIDLPERKAKNRPNKFEFIHEVAGYHWKESQFGLNNTYDLWCGAELVTSAVFMESDAGNDSRRVRFIEGCYGLWEQDENEDMNDFMRMFKNAIIRHYRDGLTMGEQFDDLYEEESTLDATANS